MRWYETHHPFDTDEVVSKRWHNLIYILSSAIFSLVLIYISTLENHRKAGVGKSPNQSFLFI